MQIEFSVPLVLPPSADTVCGLVGGAAANRCAWTNKLPAPVTRDPPIQFRRWFGRRGPGEMLASAKRHQQEAACTTMSSTRRGHVLAFGLGSGKTLSAIMTAEQYGGAVIVVPKALEHQWRCELRRWRAMGAYTLVSYQRFYRHPIDLTNRVLIVDEAHALRNSQSKMAKVIFGEAKRAKKVIMLSGTPMYNSPHELGNLINPVLKPGEEKLPATQKEWEAKFATKDPKEYAKRVRDYVVYYKPEPDPQFYPKVSEKFVKIEATPDQRRCYKAIEEKNLDLLQKLAPLLQRQDQNDAKTERSLAKLIKQLTAFSTAARQIPNAPCPQPGGKPGSGKKAPPTTLADVPKIKHIVDWLRRPANKRKRVVVFSNFLAKGVMQLAPYLMQDRIPFGVFTGKEKRKDRERAVEDYNRGKLRVLLISSAGGEGLDLKNTDAVFVMEPAWNWSRIRQAIGRAARFKSHTKPGSTVRVYKFLTKFHGAKLGGIEAAMKKVADRKQKVIDRANAEIVRQSNKVVRARSLKCQLP